MLADGPVLFFDIRPFTIFAKADKDSGRADVRSLKQDDRLALFKHSVRHWKIIAGPDAKHRKAGGTENEN